MLDLQPTTRLDADEPDQAGCGRMRGWCVVHTHPQAERWADANLQRAGYGTYLPLYATRRRDRALPSISHTVLVPLFPGYLFVAMSRGDPWTPIRYAMGVRALVMTGPNPDMVRAGHVEALQASEAARRTIEAGKSLWAPGTPCSARYGALCGYPAAVVSVRGDQAVIAVMLFGALREVRVPVASLEARSD